MIFTVKLGWSHVSPCMSVCRLVSGDSIILVIILKTLLNYAIILIIPDIRQKQIRFRGSVLRNTDELRNNLLIGCRDKCSNRVLVNICLFS